MYKLISSLDGHHLFQCDLNAITSWLVQNSMTLNAAKCKYMLVRRKRCALLPACTHSLLAHPLLLWTCIKYLGVHISSDLSWSAHTDTVVSKARNTLGIIYSKFYRNVNTSVLTKLYTTLVRPLLEYSCTLIFKRTSINRSQCKDSPARSVPRIGQLLIVITCIFLAFQPFMIVEYFSNCAQCSRLSITPSLFLKA